MAQQTAEVLRRARGFVERGWCQKAMARFANGQLADPWVPEAVEWCVLGAIEAAIGAEIMSDIPPSHALTMAVRLKRSTLTEWNDKRGRTKEQVLRAFDRAIAAEEAS